MIVLITGAFPRGEDKGGSAPKDLIEFGEGQIIVGGGGVKNSRGGEKNSKHTISILAPPSDFFPTYSPD